MISRGGFPLDKKAAANNTAALVFRWPLTQEQAYGYV